jgi:CRISPR type I-E-associated protein CasB/Cse2
MNEPSVPAAPGGAAPRRRSHKVIDVIAEEIAENRIPPGDQAALRREQPGPAFWRMAVRHLEPAGLLLAGDGPKQRRTARRWVAILAGVARARESHTPGRPLGLALAEAGITEARVLRLARAHDEALLDVIRALSDQLARSGERVDWGDLADLILSDGERRQEEVRRRMCLDYYRALWRAAQPLKEDS